MAITPSGYLRYLPPVLWSPPAPAGSFDLGWMLCAFEKVLTGIRTAFRSRRVTARCSPP